MCTWERVDCISSKAYVPPAVDAGQCRAVTSLIRDRERYASTSVEFACLNT